MPNEIVRAEIHPGIGIARIGNSDEWMLAPEVVRPALRRPEECRDANGAIKREGARFRIYGYDADNNVVAELTTASAEIEWTVHLAATKADWYLFIAAMDRPEIKDRRIPLRNAGYDAAKRADLRIDPGPIAIAGGNATAKCRGTFRYETKQEEVLIGELVTDDLGRLIVLSGQGASGSPTGLSPVTPDFPDWFGNSVGWYDDIADGPLTARIAIDGRQIPCSHAWVASAPPNFAPDMVGWRTLDEQMQETFIEAGWLQRPERPSFTQHIYPLFARLTGLEWVNKGIADVFGVGSLLDFTDSKLIDKICRIHAVRDNDIYQSLRRSLANMFRGKDKTAWQALPPIYGDTFGTIGTNAADLPGNLLSVSELSSRFLDQWVDGDFDQDWQGVPSEQEFASVALAEQPTMLDRAAMHHCLADAFHPGCELTWPMRHISLFEAPYRIKMRDPGAPVPDFGPELSSAAVLAVDGPLHAQGPGDLTRWMALPWQVDTLGCRSGYFDEMDPYLPTFWPARVPNQVLSAGNYRKLMDLTLDRSERIAAYFARDSWYDPLGPFQTFPEGVALLIAHLDRLGIVCQMPAPSDADQLDIPASLYVETVSDNLALGMLIGDARAEFLKNQGPPNPADLRARDAGWLNDRQRREFLTARFPALAPD